MSAATPAILVLTFLLVAGGGWHWAYERHVVTYRKGDRDRLARLAAASVAYLAVAAWPLYEIYDQIWPAEAGQRSHPSWWVWPLVPAGLAAPIVIGALQGKKAFSSSRFGSRLAATWIGRRSSQWWRYLFRESGPWPTAYDYALGRATAEGHRPTLLIHLKSDDSSGEQQSVLGLAAYVAASPHPHDVYLEPYYGIGSIEELQSRWNAEEPMPGGILIRREDTRAVLIWYPHTAASTQQGEQVRPKSLERGE